MAKKSMLARNKKRGLLIQKFRLQREEIKAVIVSPDSTDDERRDAVIKLGELPRDSSYSRQRSRCYVCGRSRAYNRLTGLCRIHMRYAVMNGLVPGMHKASW